MIYSIDSMHLNNGHMYSAQFMHIFGSVSCVQQLIIPERLNQIYVMAYRGKRRFLAFQWCVIQAICHLWAKKCGRNQYYISD